MQKLKITVVAALTATALAGCAGAPTPTASSSPGVTELGHAASIEQVRDAYIDAGGECDWDQSNQVKLAAASGSCSDDAVLSIYESAAKKEEAIQTIGILMSEGLTLLVGENWIINAPAAEEMQAQIGGEWVTEVEPSGTSQPDATGHTPFCEVFATSSAAYTDAVVDGDSVALSGLATWADDLEHNIAPGYADIVAEYVKPIRQVVDAQKSGDTSISLDLKGFKSGFLTLSTGCIPGDTTDRLNYDSDATP